MSEKETMLEAWVRLDREWQNFKALLIDEFESFLRKVRIIK